MTLLLCIQCCLHLMQLTDLEVSPPVLLAYIPNLYSDKSTHTHTHVRAKTHITVSAPACLKDSLVSKLLATCSQQLSWTARSGDRERLWRGAGRRAGAQELGPHPRVLGPVTFAILVPVSSRVSVSGLFSSSQRHLISCA